MLPYMAEVDLNKAYRLLNVGGTTLVSASFDGVSDIMPATWPAHWIWHRPRRQWLLTAHTLRVR